jgi:tol-pal system protein YbgF
MKNVILLSVASLFLLANCGNYIALVKKEDWDRQQQEMDAMRSEVKKMEMQMDNLNKETEQQLNLMRADFNQLFTDLGRNMNQISGQIEESKNDLQKISKTTEKLSDRKYVLKGAGRAPGDTSAGGDSVVIEDKVDVQKLFQIARKDMNAKDYERARKEFEELASKFSTDPVAADCQYWVGEILFVQKQYKEAIAKYKDIAKTFPQSAILPSAIFKAGLCYQKLNDKANMKKAWDELIQKYPYSDEAMQAKARMN